MFNKAQTPRPKTPAYLRPEPNRKTRTPPPPRDKNQKPLIGAPKHGGRMWEETNRAIKLYESLNDKKGEAEFRVLGLRAKGSGLGLRA